MFPKLMLLREFEPALTNPSVYMAFAVALATVVPVTNEPFVTARLVCPTGVSADVSARLLPADVASVITTVSPLKTGVLSVTVTVVEEEVTEGSLYRRDGLMLVTVTIKPVMADAGVSVPVTPVNGTVTIKPVVSMEGPDIERVAAPQA
jgi:ABC-type glucose/galactose transport system permease subunit